MFACGDFNTGLCTMCPAKSDRCPVRCRRVYSFSNIFCHRTHRNFINSWSILMIKIAIEPLFLCLLLWKTNKFYVSITQCSAVSKCLQIHVPSFKKDYQVFWFSKSFFQYIMNLDQSKFKIKETSSHISITTCENVLAIKYHDLGKFPN